MKSISNQKTRDTNILIGLWNDLFKDLGKRQDEIRVLEERLRVLGVVIRSKEDELGKEGLFRL